MTTPNRAARLRAEADLLEAEEAFVAAKADAWAKKEAGTITFAEYRQVVADHSVRDRRQAYRDAHRDGTTGAQPDTATATATVGDTE